MAARINPTLLKTRIRFQFSQTSSIDRSIFLLTFFFNGSNLFGCSPLSLLCNAHRDTPIGRGHSCSFAVRGCTYLGPNAPEVYFSVFEVFLCEMLEVRLFIFDSDRTRLFVLCPESFLLHTVLDVFYFHYRWDSGYVALDRCLPRDWCVIGVSQYSNRICPHLTITVTNLVKFPHVSFSCLTRLHLLHLPALDFCEVPRYWVCRDANAFFLVWVGNAVLARLHLVSLCFFDSGRAHLDFLILSPLH